LQKEVESNPNSPAVKIVCGPQQGHCEKRYEIQGGSQEIAVVVGLWQFFLITKIQVNLVPNPSEMWRKQHKFI